MDRAYLSHIQSLNQRGTFFPKFFNCLHAFLIENCLNFFYLFIYFFYEAMNFRDISYFWF